MKNMKLSEIFNMYDLSIRKDINKDFYIKDDMNYFHSLKTWTYAGNNMLSVIDNIPDSLIESEINDIMQYLVVQALYIDNSKKG